MYILRVTILSTLKWSGFGRERERRRRRKDKEKK